MSVEIGPSAATNLRMVEFGRDPAVELTGCLLAEAGAEVTKVEPPGGSPSQALPPFAGVPSPPS